MTRVALIFDDVRRPDTTGVHCRRALETVCQVEFFRPDQLPQIPRTGFDLYLNIDDGLEYGLPKELRPSAYWAIDTHLNPERNRLKCQDFDLVFAAQRNGAEDLRRSGIGTAIWLPLACDPEIHRPHPVVKQRDVCFVGNMLPGPRIDLVRLLQQHYRDMFVGQAYRDEMAAIFSASRFVFNRSVRDDLNMRVFEALGCGSLLVTNDLSQNGQAELFRDGVHLAAYTSGEDLVDKLRFYSQRDDLRVRIEAAGREEAHAKHTYIHRMRTILEVADQRRLAAVNGFSPPTTGDGPGEITVGAPAEAVALEAAIAPLRQDMAYFEFPRPELLALIPRSARRVLDVGCAAGRLGESLKQRQTCQVVGIERDERAAARAKGRLDEVLVGDAERLELFERLSPGQFDAIVLGDVLEHLRQPAELLARLRALLAPGGVLIASIPNVRHHTVVRRLLEGNFTYEPAGLLDRTHLAFFTRRDIARLFGEAGYRTEHFGGLTAPGEDAPARQEQPTDLAIGHLRLTSLSPDEAQEFFVYQWLVVAAPAQIVRAQIGAPQQAQGGAQPASGILGSVSSGEAVVDAVSTGPKATRDGPVGLASDTPACRLLMVTYNRLAYTRLALEAVLALDYPELEIVVWDNASADGSLEYLRQRLAGLPNARLIESPRNMGVVYPMNAVWWAAAEAGRPEPQLLAKIDNDTRVPADLLRRLAQCHARSDRLGVLSGFHFRDEGEALVDPHRLIHLDRVALLAQPYVGGCAVMVRRQVLDRLGPIASCKPEGQGALMDFGWTQYQERVAQLGLLNGYPWPPVHVDHMEDTRSPHSIRTPEYETYKRSQRGMGLDEYTRQLCVWRPSWLQAAGGQEAPPAAFIAANGNGQANAQASAHGSQNGVQHLPIASAAKNPLPNRRPSAGRLKFRQDFDKDFDQFVYQGAAFGGPAYAFLRFADGERAILMGRGVQAVDGWSYRGGAGRFAEALRASLVHDDPDYYLGISDGCCDRSARDWYLAQLAVPLDRVTFANVFVNGNYQRFRQLDLRHTLFVASQAGDIHVPADLMHYADDYDFDRLVDQLLAADRPILVAAGPASCVIIHKYWQRALPERRQVIVDVGSALDERTKGRGTRGYHLLGSPTAQRVCTW